MVGRLEGKVAIITGGASGIGEGTVRKFIEEGAKCVIADIQSDLANSLAEELGGNTTSFALDVADESQIEACVDFAIETYGKLDIMFNNAGILGSVGPISEIDGDGWLRTMDVLLNSVFYGIKHAARVMQKQGSGAIINTASTAGVRAGLGPHVYTAAKHAVVGLSQSVATELGRHGIRVNVIAPGGTISGLTARLVTGDHQNLDKASTIIGANNPLQRAGRPEDIANAVLYLASDEASFTNGAVLVVDAAGESIGDRNGRFVQMGSQTIQEADKSGL
ncbi:MAG: glucose 1-dehydrogenase [Acidimicrobiales bacterium]|jgi:NAD(P)-dependent dehydrogenase (short-subunit alcohol dehydrogenase family)|nr:glucose 1-dehydrogenase [Acidimicrobiales bacterium]MDP6297843.1 glucose 1-dehydrogenase [Acidimicrobiales bacterium]HJM29415.1 glucose 1-dehydrogenase [Acidimicrobiales bacterium]HJM96893.1 glucose 1-dehydrogenase [Acidimicrobiales bacterium]